MADVKHFRFPGRDRSLCDVKSVTCYTNNLDHITCAACQEFIRTIGDAYVRALDVPHSWPYSSARADAREAAYAKLDGVVLIVKELRDHVAGRVPRRG